MKRALQITWIVAVIAIGIPAATFFFAMMYGTFLYWAVAFGFVVAVAWVAYLKGKEAGRAEAPRLAPAPAKPARPVPPPLPQRAPCSR